MALLMKPEPFSSEVNRFFNTLFDDGRLQQRWVPAMDLVESDDHFVLKADLPGLGEDDVSIEIRDNTLTVAGERKSEYERKERGWYRVERSTGSFSRSLALPEGVDADAVTAAFDKGVLEIRIPKPEQKKPRRIQISAGAGNGSANGNGQPAAVEGTATERTAA
jgi:HSP20 family protein